MWLAVTPSAATFVAAAALWLLLGVVPGLLLATALDPDRAFLDRLAVAPLVSIATAFAGASWLGVVGVARPLDWVVPFLLVVSAAAALIVARRARSVGGSHWIAPARRRPSALLAAILVLAVVVWIVAISTSEPGWSMVLPNLDGNSHGFFLTRLLMTGSTDPSDILLPDPTGQTGVALVYPLGLHVLAAPIAAITSAASALVVPMTIGSSLMFIVGTTALTRRIGSSSAALWAGLAAAVLVPWLPFGQLPSGLLPMTLAIALVPGATLALLDVRAGRGLIVPALAVAGLLSLHVTEVLIAAALAGLTLLGSRTPAQVRWRWIRRAALATLLALVVVAPFVWSLRSVSDARPSDESQRLPLPVAVVVAVSRPFILDLGIEGALLPFVIIGTILAMAMTVIGGLRAWPNPLGRAVTILILGVTATATITYVTSVGPLAAPWYGNPARLTAQAAGLIPCLVGLGIAAVLTRIPRRVLPVAAVVGSLAVAVSATQCVLSTSSGISRFSVVTPADRDAFAWLSLHTSPGERVLNDYIDGSVWVYDATHGRVIPMFGPQPGGGFANKPAYADPIYLRDTIATIATNSRTRDIARAWSVRYVLVGERTLGDLPPLLDAASLDTAPGLRLVYSVGDARVYEITAP